MAQVKWKLTVYLVIIVAIVIFLYFLGQRPQPEQHEVSAATPTPLPLPPLNQPAPTAAPAMAAAPAQPPVTPITAMATKYKVKVTQMTRQGMSGIIQVEWASDVVTQGTDFMDAVRQAGHIHMFEPDGPPGAKLEDGRRVWVVKYKVSY